MTPLNNIVQTDESETKKSKKPYVTREQKEAFIQWYLKKYGYNTHLKENNSRVVSEQYERETGVIIPKISVFRWLNKLESKKVENFAKEFIDPEMLNQ